MKDFKDRVAVITGAASGIGRGLAEYSVKQGMKVVLADIEEPALFEVEQAFKNNGASVLAVRTDVSSASDVETLARKALDKFGAVHLLFNNAGVQTRKSIWESTLEDWKWVIGVNLWGVIHGVTTFVPIMLEQKAECHIVNTASIAGLVTGTAISTYRVAKHGVVVLSETLYLELKERGARIDVSVLCPGTVRSRLNEAGRNRPEELRNIDETALTPEEQKMEKRFQEHNDNGISPEQCAEIVFNAILKNEFYILTPPDWKTAIRERMENILQGRNPRQPEYPGR